jgi:cation diffusion facilitator CzcD-associated flavoprotein CzcO
MAPIANGSDDATDNTTTVLIVGAGLSGIAAAYECKVHGHPFVVLEMDAKLGGTWYTQNFPGIRADSLHIQNLFSYHPVASDSITSGSWLQHYLEDVAKTHGLLDHIRFDTKVLGVNWDSCTGVWEVSTQDVRNGDTGHRLYKCRFVLNANGYFDLHKPNIPQQFQDAKFAGKMVHSANMTRADDADLHGKKVVLIGSGATATTMVPELLKYVQSLTWVFRSSSHCVPIFRLPWFAADFHNCLIQLHNRGFKLPFQIYRFVFLSFIQGFMQAMANVFPKPLARWIYSMWNGTSADIFDKFFKPDFNFGEQRICLIDDIPGVMSNPKLRPVKGVVSAIHGRALSVKDANNDVSELSVDDVDTIVLCTGYDLSYFKFDLSIDGKKRHMPDQVLRREMLFEKVPNFFFLCLFNRLTPRTTTSGPPGLEVMCKMTCRIISHMDQNSLKAFYIKPEKDKSKVTKLSPMIAGYIGRNRDKCFQGIAAESNDACRWKYMFWERPFEPREYIFE